jgi:lipopolysaccharide biosynthesis glycosyltransferase
MLVNHKKWIKDKIDSKMREHLRHNHYEVADQDLCNVFFKDKIKLVSVEYNFSTVFYGYDIKKYIKANGFTPESFYSYNEIMEAYYTPKIIHSQFGITGRPWQVGNDNPVGLLWHKYLELTPWKNVKMPEAKKDMNWRLYELLPQAIIVKLYAWAVKRKFAK